MKSTFAKHDLWTCHWHGLSRFGKELFNYVYAVSNSFCQRRDNVLPVMQHYIKKRERKI